MLIDAIASISTIKPQTQIYLPRYLPQRVYFLLARRPFLSEKSSLLIETPAQILDLEAYSEQKQQDVQTYIEQYISATPSFLKKAGWIINHSISEQEFCRQMTVCSENNFMYLKHILNAISQGFYLEPFQFEPLPSGLEVLYGMTGIAPDRLFNCDDKRSVIALLQC